MTRYKYCIKIYICKIDRNLINKYIMNDSSINNYERKKNVISLLTIEISL